MENSGRFKKGHTPWHKGKKGLVTGWAKGKKLSKSHRKKLSEAHKGKNRYGSTELLSTEEVLERGRIAHRAYSKTPKGKYKSYRWGALKRGFVFELTFEEFLELITDICFYCGSTGFGVDRVDSNIGYIKDNCVSCCKMCNKMKMEFDMKIFINQCRLIVNNTNLCL